MSNESFDRTASHMAGEYVSYNEPVAWGMLDKDGGIYDSISPEEHDREEGAYTIPLYTHPVKEQKCVVKDCENHRNEGGFTGDLCNPCYQFIANGEGVYSQAYRNVHPAKTLTDEEILKMASDYLHYTEFKQGIQFARAILRKASEK